jgi:hypothetical protein
METRLPRFPGPGFQTRGKGHRGTRILTAVHNLIQTKVIRICPALSTTPGEAERALSILDEALDAASTAEGKESGRKNSL